jgi:hypothetical protein
VFTHLGSTNVSVGDKPEGKEETHNREKWVPTVLIDCVIRVCFWSLELSQRDELYLLFHEGVQKGRTQTESV